MSLGSMQDVVNFTTFTTFWQKKMCFWFVGTSIFVQNMQEIKLVFPKNKHCMAKLA